MFDKEDRIQQIKDCGQSLIDNAEKIYGEYPYTTGELIIDIVMSPKQLPTIEFRRTFYPEKMFERLKN